MVLHLRDGTPRADVTAIDYVDLDTFRGLHRAMKSRAKYYRLDVYELDPERLGYFDIVLCLASCIT